MFQKTQTRRNHGYGYGSKRSSNHGSNSASSHFQRRGRAGSSIHPSQLIQKAQPIEKMADFVPKHDFRDFSFDQKLQLNIEKKGYSVPTPIQDQAIPIIFEGKDFVGIANTGTGKTAAFLLPLLQKILVDRRQRVLIIAPTRELAVQIHQELVSFAFGMGIYSVTCIGGDSIGRQIRDLRRLHHFVIGTPGRIKDLCMRKVLVLKSFQNVVLDEADRMLDMGFINDIRYLLSLLSSQRQSLFFSATISSEIHSLIRTFLRDPVTVSVKKQESSANVEQDVVKIPRGINKFDVLQDLLKQAQFEKVLIFARTKRGVEKLSSSLERRGFLAASIHGDKTQFKRQMALNLFKNNRIKILVATDVAARGLDIPNVSHVINFDLPANYEDYVHRIGRTGRVDKKGIALSFVDG